MSERRGRIHEKHDLSKTRRCELLDVPRSSAYYRGEPASEADLAVMRLIDEIYLQWPFYGSRRMRDELEERGHTVNRKRVQRLMRQMGLRALYPRRRTSQPGKGHRFTPTCSGTCPSSVRTRPGQVTSATSRWPRGSCTWWRSWTGILDGCCQGYGEALEEALQRFEAPEIFNTDQVLSVILFRRGFLGLFLIDRGSICHIDPSSSES